MSVGSDTYMGMIKTLVLTVAGFVAVACVVAIIAGIVFAVQKKKDKDRKSK